MGARETTHARRRAAPPQSSARRDVEGADGARDRQTRAESPRSRVEREVATRR